LQLFKLPHMHLLENLTLSALQNSVNGSLIRELSNCSRLRTVDLHDNQFLSDKIFATFPASCPVSSHSAVIFVSPNLRWLQASNFEHRH
jgi:hypothetical protein